MTTLDTATVDTGDNSGEGGLRPGRVKETNYNGKVDAFSVAFNGAKDEIEAKAERSKPGPKPSAKKSAAAADEDEEKPAPKKPKTEAESGKPQDRSYADADDEDGEDSEPDKPSKKAKSGTREPPKYWSEKKKEAFRFQTREVQAELLDAEPEASERWDTDTREAFAKLPREAKEIVLSQLSEADKGLNQKFQALAAERKLAEDIRAAVPPQMRGFMQQNGVTEPQAFSKLLQYQHHAMTDPIGYLRQFIANNKINVLDIIPMDGDQTSNGQNATTRPADVSSHPAYQSMKAELDALKQSTAQDRNQRAQEEARRFAQDFDGILQEKDGDGNSVYPYIRLLADPMAKIINADPERFSSMAVKDRFQAAYRIALQDYPELVMPKRTAKSSPVDEQDDDEAQTEPTDRRAEKLEKAITPKSRTSVTIPGNGKTGDPLSDAIKSAQKQLAKKR